MASSGTIRQSIRTGYAIQIFWKVDSQFVANNTSTVTASVQLVSTGSSYTINSSATKSGSLTINGTKYTFTFSASLSGNQTKTIFSKTVAITHNADGSRTCSFACEAGINVTLSGTYYGTVTASGSGIFDTIARASTISSVTSSVAINGTNAVSVGITRALSSFTHTVVFSFGSYSQTQTGIGTSTSFVIPTTWINAMSNATSGTATVTVTTYSGSTKIGSSVHSNFTVTIPSGVAPTIASVAISEGTAGIQAKFGAYVQNHSTLKIVTSASGIYSSTIRSIKTNVNGIVYSGSNITTNALTTSGTVTVVITVTDSRGREATITRSITVVPYSAPKITTFKGFRCRSNGVDDPDGTYLNAVVNFSISSVNNKNNNTYSISYRLKDASTWTTMTSGTGYEVNRNIVSSTGFLSQDSPYEIRIVIADFFGSATAVFDIASTFTLIDFNGSSGKGIAFGKVSEMNAMEVNMDILDKYSKQIRNGVAFYEGGGSTNPNTSLEELILTATNVPISGKFFFIRTVFYSTKSTSTNRTQIAIPYNDKYSIYYRYYFNGTWTAWHETPVVIDKGTTGIWTWKKYSDGTAECFGKINVSGVAVTTALGNWYRCPNLYTATEYPYPVTFSEAPVTEMMFQTRNSSSALLWVFSESADTALKYLPQCYLIRPVTATSVIGNVNIYVKGKY